MRGPLAAGKSRDQYLSECLKLPCFLPDQIGQLVQPLWGQATTLARSTTCSKNTIRRCLLFYKQRDAASVQCWEHILAVAKVHERHAESRRGRQAGSVSYRERRTYSARSAINSLPSSVRCVYIVPGVPPVDGNPGLAFRSLCTSLSDVTACVLQFGHRAFPRGGRLPRGPTLDSWW